MIIEISILTWKVRFKVSMHLTLQYLFAIVVAQLFFSKLFSWSGQVTIGFFFSPHLMKVKQITWVTVENPILSESKGRLVVVSFVSTHGENIKYFKALNLFCVVTETVPGGVRDISMETRDSTSVHLTFCSIPLPRRCHRMNGARSPRWVKRMIYPAGGCGVAAM
jgi:hypothetical protein